MPTAKKISTPKQKEETIWERGKQLINLVGSRKLQLFFDSEPEHTSKRIKIPNKKVTKNKRREISPNSYTTTKINSRRYCIPESINLTKHTFGYRNRGPIKQLLLLLFLISNLKKVYLLIIRIIQVQILLVNLFLVNIQIFLMEV